MPLFQNSPYGDRRAGIKGHTWVIPNVTAVMPKSTIQGALVETDGRDVDLSEIGREFAGDHAVVIRPLNMHAQCDGHIDTARGAFAIIKQGMYEIHQHVSK